MSDYKVVDAEFLDSGMSRVANAIKAKSGNNENMPFPEGFEERVNSIPESYWSEEDVFCLMSANRSSLTSIKIPNSITIIPRSFFYGMSKLVVNFLPDTIESIDNDAFRDCGSLDLKELPSCLKNIGHSAFRGARIPISALPEGLEIIDAYAFLTKREMTINSIPASVKTLGARCFQDAFSEESTVTTITFKGTPDTIDSTSFANCSNLTVINVPWAEGEVANAPWGASNVITINYNYVESEG